VYLWRKLVETRWLNAHENILHARSLGRLAIISRPERKRLHIEIACTSRNASRKLVEQFGGRVEELPRNWLDRFARISEAKPIKIGKRLIVAKPANGRRGCNRHQPTPVRRARPDAPRRVHATAQIGERQFLLIPASIAFGTGEHATTAMSLRFLEELSRGWKRGWSLVDLGTGSGILALAAKRFGAGRVTAIDADPTAISIAESNARLNQIHGVTFRLSDVRKWRSTHETNVITANLHSELLIEILSKLKRGGRLILSGILHRDEAEFLHALSRNNLEIIKIKRRGKWIAILARCSGTLRAADLACGKFLRRSQTAARVERNAN